jgi:putative flippase GtrA
VRERLILLLRSALAGGAATVVDLGALALMVSGLGVAPRIASVPALVLAATVNFLGNRRAFAAEDGDARLQALRFTIVLAVTFGLNAVIFDLGMRIIPATFYWALRLVVSNVVYLCWSFPMFGYVFRRGSARATLGRSP